MLRAFEDRDVAMVRDLATDPYIPLVGTLVAGADKPQALTYIAAQRTRHEEGIGYSFCVADAVSDEALGTVGLWLRDLHEGRATAGYSVAPAARGHGVAADALVAVTALAWGVRALHRVSLHIEPWNRASLATAERAGYQREGLLRSWMEVDGVRVDALAYAALRPHRDSADPLA